MPKRGLPITVRAQSDERLGVIEANRVSSAEKPSVESSARHAGIPPRPQLKFFLILVDTLGDMKRIAINLTRISGQVFRVERCNAEGLPRAFRVAGRDDGRVEIEKTLGLKKTVCRHGQAIAQPRHRSEGIRPRPKMGDFAQELHGMPFLLKRVGFWIGDGPQHFYRFRENLIERSGWGRRNSACLLNP